MTLSDGAENGGADRLLSVLRVPLIVMALGALFLVEDYGGPAASRTWPALLVLLGALMAAGRRRTQ